MNDAEKVREALAELPSDLDWSYAKQALDSILAELAEARARYDSINWSSRNWTSSMKRLRAELAEAEQARVDLSSLVDNLTERDRRWAASLKAAEERAEKWAARCERAAGQRDAFAARIQTLEAENDRLRQGLVEALEGEA